MDHQDALAERYYGLMTLQRRVNLALGDQVAYISGETRAAEQALKREIEKFVRTDTDPAIFRAITRAAREAPDEANFARTAEITATQLRLKSLTAQYGAPVAFRKALSDTKEALTQKEQRAEALKASTARLEERLEPIFDWNRRKSPNISPANRRQIEDVGFFGRMNGDNLAEASSLVTAYAKQHGVQRPNSFIKANCFDDLEQLSDERKELEALGPAIEFAKDRYYRQLGDYKDVRDVQTALARYGIAETVPVDLTAFQQAFAARLGDSHFLAGFARETASGVGGDVVLAALTANIRRQIEQNLTGYQLKIAETTRLLEGPIGSVARALKRDVALDYIERDIKWQAGMAGYLGASATAAFRGLASFRPDHTEGPVSLGRDIRMHMAVNANVDPAYIQEVCGMDGLLTRYFNLNAFRPRPDFKTVLQNPASVERLDRHYADFLRGMADDEDFSAAGFAAGQFDHVSFDRLLGRYFPADTTREQMASALREEAARIEAVEDQRESMGISRGGPKLPEI